MADLTRDDVLKLARLARLDLSDEEVDSFRSELDEILHYVEQLDDVDITGLEPTSQVTGLVNVTRDDVEKSYGYVPEELLQNVPRVQNNHIKVQRMID
jgi:aspartyl-tRNA(Asn)/glutamyl-tRNA(Gln) amidotransferase subunit C